MTLGELLNEPYRLLKDEGIKVHFDLWHGSFCDAKEVELVIRRLYSQIDNLTEAYDEVEK